MTSFASAGRRPPKNSLSAFIAGVLLTVGETLFHPTIVLVFFASQLTDSLRTLGFVASVALLGWYLPQLVAPWFAGVSSRQLPWALGSSIIRSAAAIFLAYSAYRTDVTEDQRLRAFFICYIAYSLASGFAQLPVNELIARGVSGDLRSRMIRQRNLWGGVIAVGAAFVAREVFEPGGPGFPRNVSLIFIAAATSISAATFFIGRIREPRLFQPKSAAGRRPRARDFAGVLADGAFRRFAFFGLIGGATTLADPFYVIYARREFALPSIWIGTFLMLFAAGSILSAPLWAGIVRFGGARAAIQTATAVKVIAPLIVLSLPYAIDSDLYRDHVTDERVVFYILAAPFAVLGVATRGFVAGNFSYLMDIAVPERRSAYQMLALTPLIAAAAAPLAGAEIADQWGFDRLFLVAVLAGFVAVIGAGILAATSKRVRVSSAAYRLRGARS